MALLYDQCIKHIKDNLHISHAKDLIIDPHASNPSFIDGIQTLANLVLCYNKSPIYENVMPLDLLNIDFTRYDKTFLAGLWYDDIHVISHPPPEQAEEFIVAVCKFAQSVSFIMPKKAQYAFPTNYQRLFSTDLQGMKDTVFQIWLRSDY